MFPFRSTAALLFGILAAKGPPAHAPLCIGDPPMAITPPSAPLPGEDATAAITHFSFVVYGDTRGAFDGVSLQPGHDLVAHSIVETMKKRAKGPDAIRFVLMTGDAVTDGRIGLQWDVSFTPIVDRITDAGAHYFPIVGNHDVTIAPKVDAPERARGLCNFLAATAQLIPGDGSAHRLNGYPAYGFGFGNTFFLTFDATIANDSTQYFWVERQLNVLDRQRYPNIIVFLHQPPISSGPHGGPLLEPASATLRTFFMPLFRRHHVRVVFSGHDHFYEHWVERYRDSTGAQRLDQIVTAGGGAPAYTYRGEPDLRDYLSDGAGEQLTVEHLVKPSPDATRNPLHYVIVTVDGAELRLEVVGVDRGRGFAPYAGKSGVVLK